MYDQIDWQQQWALHGFNFRDGYVHIDFEALGLQVNSFWRRDLLRLQPGAGFGDFSHPTTRLVWRLMAPHIIGKEVLDVGCGSGILALSAIALGARSAIGIDIEEEAVTHARMNTSLNELDGFCSFSLSAPPTLQNSQILLMNMIRSEQACAYQSIAHLPIQQAFTSGVLREEREQYLMQVANWHWQLIDEREEEGWLAFRFTKQIL